MHLWISSINFTPAIDTIKKELVLLEHLSNHGVLARFSAFVFIALVAFEYFTPRRTKHYSKTIRWMNNHSITVINALANNTINEAG